MKKRMEWKGRYKRRERKEVDEKKGKRTEEKGRKEERNEKNGKKKESEGRGGNGKGKRREGGWERKGRGNNPNDGSLTRSLISL